MVNKNIILLSLLLFCGFIMGSDSKKEENNLEAWLGKVGPRDIQNLICQYYGWYEQEFGNYSKKSAEDRKLNAILRIAKTPNGKFLASIDSDSVKIWDINNVASQIKCINTLTFKGESPNCLDFSSDNKYLAVGFLDVGRFIIYDIQNIEKIKEDGSFQLKKLEQIRTIKFSRDNKFLAVGGSGICVFNINNKAKITIANLKEDRGLSDSHYYCTNVISFTQDNKYMASADTLQSIIIWDSSAFPSLRKICKLIGYTATPYGCMDGISFSPDSKYLASTGRDHLKIWNIEDTKKVECIYEDRLYGNLSLEYSPNGKFLACGKGDSTITIFNLSNLSNITKIALGKSISNDNTDLRGSILFSNDGNTIFWCGSSEKIISRTSMIRLLSSVNPFMKKCQNCNKTESENTKLLRCSRCRKVRYCNATCQRNDWPNHKDNC